MPAGNNACWIVSDSRDSQQGHCALLTSCIRHHELRRSWQPSRNFVFNLRPSRRDEGHVLSKYPGRPNRSFWTHVLIRLSRLRVGPGPTKHSGTPNQPHYHYPGRAPSFGVPRRPRADATVFSAGAAKAGRAMRVCCVHRARWSTERKLTGSELCGNQPVVRVDGVGAHSNSDLISAQPACVFFVRYAPFVDMVRFCSM